MPKAVCDSHKSAVERNVLGRLQTLTYLFLQNLKVTGYLRGKAKFPGNLFPTARPKVSVSLYTYLE